MKKKQIVKPDPELIYTKAEAAKYLGFSESTLNRRLAAQDISHYKIGRAVRFAQKHLDPFLKAVERREWIKQ